MRAVCKEHTMPKSEPVRIAILGAGPIGLEAALYAASLGMPVSVYERDRIGAHVQQWGHVRLFSPFGMNYTPLGRDVVRAENPRQVLPGDNDRLTGREHLAAYLEPLARSSLLRDKMRLGEAVLHLGRRSFLKSDAP